MFLCPWDFPGKDTWVDSHFVLQGIFLVEELNLSLLHWQADSLPTKPPGKHWVAVIKIAGLSKKAQHILFPETYEVFVLSIFSWGKEEATSKATRSWDQQTQKILVVTSNRGDFPKLCEGTCPHSSTLAWKIPWMEEPGRLQSMGSLRVGHDWAIHFHFSLSCIGEGNGNPLQCSCLENPRDGGAWWAAVYGVAQSWTRLKWLSSSSSSPFKWSFPKQQWNQFWASSSSRTILQMSPKVGWKMA